MTNIQVTIEVCPWSQGVCETHTSTHFGVEDESDAIEEALSGWRDQEVDALVVEVRTVAGF